MNSDISDQIDRDDDKKTHIDIETDKTQLSTHQLQDGGTTVQVYYLCHADLKVKIFARYGIQELSSVPVFIDSDNNMCIQKLFTENSEDEETEDEETVFELKYIKKLISIQSIKVQQTLDNSYTLTHAEVYSLFLPILL